MNKKNLALLAVIVVIIIAILYVENFKAPVGGNLDKSNNLDTASDTGSSQQTTSLQDIASKDNRDQTNTANSKNPRAEIIAQKKKKFKKAPELVSPDGYINLKKEGYTNYTDKITISELIGKKVILIDFWTYSCINCQRTLPYITSWYNKYKDSGLEIIGVHTPEFDFEKKYDNVLAAVNKWKIDYPIVQDNNYWTWQAFKNRYWPRKYIIDIDGFIVYDHIGEGGYTETERVIQGLLEERKEALASVLTEKEMGEIKEINKEISEPEGIKQKEYSGFRILTPELYLAAGTNRGNFGNKEGFSLGNTITYSLPKDFDIHNFYFDGDWLNNNDNTELKSANGKLVLKFAANEVNLVAGADKEIAVKVKIDGKPADNIKIKAFDLYNVYSSSDYGSHVIELEAIEPGLMVYSFTFG